MFAPGHSWPGGPSLDAVSFSDNPLKILLRICIIVPEQEEEKRMSYVEIVKSEEGITLKLTHVGRIELREYRIDTGAGPDWSNRHDVIFADLLKDHLANGWEIIQPEEIGALTAAPILSDSVTRDDSGNLLKVDQVYWFPDYAVRSELDELYENGEVFFPAAEETA
jgi:hypothetical protein